MPRTLTTALVVACALIAAAAQAAPAQEASGIYVVEPDHTEVLFGVSHLGFSTYYGQFPGASGTLTLDAAHPAKSKLDISVPVASVMTASPKLNAELAGDQWLDAGKYPTMTFHSTKIVRTGPTTADVTGDLTLHGVTRPVTLKATLHKIGDNPMMHVYSAGFEVSGHIKRGEFGVAHYLGPIGDDVTLIISAAFNRKPS